MITPKGEQLDQYTIEAIIDNSQTLAVGDAVIISAARPQAVIGAKNTTGLVLGTVRAIMAGQAAGNNPLQVNSFTAASNNVTVAKVGVKILPSFLTTTYVADLDDEAGTTTNSQYFGSFDLSATLNGTLDESSYVANGTNQFLSYGVNPGNSSQVIGIWSNVARM